MGDGYAVTAESDEMNTPANIEQYQKQQEELERQRKMLENSKDFTFINLMLRSLGLGEKK
ncbi:MAG: hypothetical protein ACJ8LD_19875 [Pantoea agglomerans]